MDTETSGSHDTAADERHAIGRWRSDSETVERRDRELGDRLTDRELADVVDREADDEPQPEQGGRAVQNGENGRSTPRRYDEPDVDPVARPVESGSSRVQRRSRR